MNRVGKFGASAWLGVAIVCSVAAQPLAIKIDVDLVNVVISVRNERGALVSGLQQNEFSLYEDGKLQAIKYFAREIDLPLTIGLLVDVSGSQRKVLERERSASFQFLKSIMQPDDRAFLVTFGSEARIYQDFTHSATQMMDALRNIEIDSALGTVLYDAIYWTGRHKLRDEPGRKVIILLTDGVDFYSSKSRSTAVEFAQRANAAIYGIYYVDPEGYGDSGDRGGKRVLGALSGATGGRMYEVTRQRPLAEVFQELEEELRSQYAIGYVPEIHAQKNEFRKIRVKMTNPKWKAYARNGYYAGPQQVR